MAILLLLVVVVEVVLVVVVGLFSNNVKSKTTKYQFAWSHVHMNDTMLPISGGSQESRGPSTWQPKSCIFFSALMS